jgi:hypothetical protein
MNTMMNVLRNKNMKYNCKHEFVNFNINTKNYE